MEVRFDEKLVIDLVEGLIATGEKVMDFEDMKGWKVGQDIMVTRYRRDGKFRYVINVLSPDSKGYPVMKEVLEVEL